MWLCDDSFPPELHSALNLASNWIMLGKCFRCKCDLLAGLLQISLLYMNHKSSNHIYSLACRSELCWNLKLMYLHLDLLFFGNIVRADFFYSLYGYINHSWLNIETPNLHRINPLKNLYDQNVLLEFCSKWIILAAYYKTDTFQNRNSAKTTVLKDLPR